MKDDLVFLKKQKNKKEVIKYLILILWMSACLIVGFDLTCAYPPESMISGFEDTFLFWLTACVLMPLLFAFLSLMLCLCLLFIQSFSAVIRNLIRLK